MYEEQFAKRLAQLRGQKGVSAREMSLAIGQGPAYINNIENQHKLPSMTGFFYICEYLGLSPKDFFDDELTIPVEARQFIMDFQLLPPEQRANILSLMEGLKQK